MSVFDYKLCDSGKREGFESGAVREVRAGKGRFDLISPFAMSRLARVMEKGAEKYSARNWEKGIPFSRLIDSAERHINSYKMGMRDEDHLAQACFNLFAVMHFELVSPGPDLDDMPRYLQEDRK